MKSTLEKGKHKSISLEPRTNHTEIITPTKIHWNPFFILSIQNIIMNKHPEYFSNNIKKYIFIQSTITFNTLSMPSCWIPGDTEGQVISSHDIDQMINERPAEDLVGVKNQSSEHWSNRSTIPNCPKGRINIASDFNFINKINTIENALPHLSYPGAGIYPLSRWSPLYNKQNTSHLFWYCQQYIYLSVASEATMVSVSFSGGLQTAKYTAVAAPIH